MTGDDRAAAALLIAEDAASRLRGPDAVEARERLETSYAECEAALGWLLEHDRPDDALRLCLALVDFWFYSDRLPEGRGWLERALSGRPAAEARAAEGWFQAGMLAFFNGDDEAAAECHQRCTAIGRDLGDPTSTALGLTGLARIALRQDVDRGYELARDALDAVAGTDDRLGRSNALHVLGVAATMRGDQHEARDWMQQRLDVVEQQQDLRGISIESANLSGVELALGSTARADDLARRALSLAVQVGDSWSIPYLVNALAAVAVARADLERAAVMLAAAERIVTEQAAAWPPDEAVSFARSRSAVSEALGPDDLARAWSTGQALSTSDAIAYALR